MIINHNLGAMNANRNMNINAGAANKSMEKLSSGLRINKAGDDAAGLAISEKMRGQIRGLDQASANAQDAISMVQTGEGALSETTSILQRMRELSVQSSNDTNTTDDRNAVQKEMNQLANEVDRIANTTEFNTQKLLDGSKQGLSDAVDGTVNAQNNSKITGFAATAASAVALDTSGTITITRTSSAAVAVGDFTIADPNGTGASLSATTIITGFGSDLTTTDLLGMAVGESVTISVKAAQAANTDTTKAISAQIGANSGQNIYIGIDSMKATDIGIRDATTGEALDVSTSTKATAAITSIDNAIKTVSGERAKLGAFSNRLEHTINNLGTSSENLTSAESRIRDVDMAKEMSTFSKNNILSQAAQAMLAQANQQPQQVLQLLR